MKMLKKSVSVLLSLTMVLGVFSIVPFYAGAATTVTTWQQLVSAVNSGSSVMLGADITSDAPESFLHITSGKSVAVDLNGYALSRGESSSAETGYIFKIESGATLRITDSGAGSTGTISGGSSEQGGAFFNEGTLLIEGGSICNNTSSISGGAVYNKGTFTMSGGVLSDNISEDGGALFNAAGGTAVISGTALLKNNESHTYGGGAVTNYGQLTLSDAAEISSNKAFMRGGGIWTGGSATLNLYGGTITENNAGITGNGVYYRDGTLNMKGSPIIRCNDEDDLFLCEGKKLHITGPLVRSSPDPVEYPNVAIVTSGSDRFVTAGYSQYNPDASDPSSFFFSYDYHYFTLENGEVYSESFKTSYVYRYWDAAAEKVRTGRGERGNAIDVATLPDNSSVSLRDNWYIVRGNVTIRHRLTIDGTANLILADGAVLTCNDGIRSERKLNSVLNIYPQSEGTGKLIAKTGGRNWAAIGGNTAADAGTFNVHGGTIEASAPFAGIAGGSNPDSADNRALAGKTLTPYERLFAKYSMSLGGDIGVNYYLDLPDEVLAQGVRVDFAWYDKTDSVTFDSNSIAETRDGVTGLYKATCYVCAAEMNDAITASIAVGENTEPVETVIHKVRDYADYIIANKDGNYSGELLTLVKSMLNYGASAQTQFGHNTDALANAGIDYPLNGLNDNEIGGIAGDVPDKTVINALLSDKEIEYYGYSLILKTRTTLRFYFKKNGADETQLAIVNGEGANVGTVKDYNTDFWYVEVEDIPASRLNECYALRFGNTTLGSFSALSYVKDVLQNDNGAQPITDTVTALYRCHAAAVAYFISIA